MPNISKGVGGVFALVDTLDRRPRLELGHPRVEKLDRVRCALRHGDVTAAAKEAKTYELLPISA